MLRDVVDAGKVSPHDLHVPEQLRNLADQPNQADRLKRMQTRLAAHLAAVTAEPSASK